MTSPRSIPSRERGNAMVEFALAAVMLTSIFTATFQYGYSFYAYNSLVTAVRDATRYASLQDMVNTGNSVVPTNFITNVRNMAIYGTIAPASDAQPIAPG